jgi:RNA polymerase sigma factor (sigma-70 family)
MSDERDDGDLPALVTAAQAGDSDAYAAIVLRFQGMALGIGHAMLGDAHLAQDAAQDAFIDAWQSLHTLREPAAFAGWFRRIVIKHVDRQMRAGQREWPMDEARELADEISLSDSIEAIYARERVQAALAALSRRQQQLADLFYLQGYSQQDIVSALDLSLSSVKKGLFLARKRLREEMHDMTETSVTQPDDLAIKTQFFIALQQHDAGKVKALLKQHPDLMDAKTEWGVLPNSNYWPLGYTALHWAAATDDTALLDVLIDGALANGADVNVRTRHWKASALHVAAMMRRPAITQKLLHAGAHPGATDEAGHTPLHIAAYYGDAESAQALIDAGAPLMLKDAGGRTALDWAIHRQREDIAALLKAKGATSKFIVENAITPDRSTPIFETGQKIIDFCAPMRRGGVNAVFTPKSGVGKVVTLEALIALMATRYAGHTFFLGVEDENYLQSGMALQFHESGLSDAVTLRFAKAGEPASFKAQAQAVLDAIAQHKGDVLLMVDAAFAERVGVQAMIDGTASPHPQPLPPSTSSGQAGEGRQASVGEGRNGEVTIIWYGDYTAGAEPAHFAHLDSVVTFELWRALNGLWPSIDPLHSHSTLMNDERHARLLGQSRRLLRRFEDLRTIIERDPRGLAALHSDEDRRDVERARRLHAFFSQPLAVAELYTNLLGEYVPLRETLDGVEAILAGEADALPEDTLRFIGRMVRLIHR